VQLVNIDRIGLNLLCMLFFAISAAIFAVSYFPAGPEVDPMSPTSISKCHNIMFRYKLRCHYVGLGFFVAGLFLLGAANLIGEPQTAGSGAGDSKGNLSDIGSSTKEASVVSSEFAYETDKFDSPS
jgi:hypothetical protein